MALGPAVLKPRLPHSALAAARVRWRVLAALGVTVLTSVLVVAAQPVRSPWWTYADADASYAATSLNMLAGRDVRFVEHPGLPLEEVGAIAFGGELLVRSGTLDAKERLRYVRETMLDLDRARPVFRGLSIGFYILGAVLAFAFVARLLGHWTWGLAGGLLWIAAPGLVAMSIQFRPDVPLAVLCLVFAYLVGRAVEQQSAAYYGGAALVAGFAVMLKLHAIGLVVPLAVAALWRPPTTGWSERLRASSARVLRRRRTLALAASAAWILLAVLLNWERVPFTPTPAQLQVLAALLTPLTWYAFLAWLAREHDRLRPVRVLFSTFVAFVAAAFVAGLLLPVTLQLPAGLQALVNVVKTSTGSGVQKGVEPFSTPFSALDDILSIQILFVFALAALGGARGIMRRDPRPTVWASGALSLGVLAFARPPNVHYFAPAFALALPSALWVLQRERRAAASILLWPVVLYIAWPAFANRSAPAVEAERFASVVTPSKALVESRLGEDEIAFVPSSWPFADSRYFEFVQIYVDYSPAYPYRYLPTTIAAANSAAQRRLRPRYYVGPQAVDVAGTQEVSLGEIGEYTARRVPQADLVLELLAGPGIDRS